jgi:type VI secretion system VasI family protein
MKIFDMNYWAKTLLIALTLTLGACVKNQTFEESLAAYERKDYETALAGFQKLSEQGDSKAQYHLGSMYHDGHGVTQDEQQARTWYRKAAELGNAEAQFMIGSVNALGSGVKKDLHQAVVWYRKAATQGHIVAQFNLAGIYMAGLGVPQDEQQAFAWYVKAAEQGHKLAQKIVSGMYAVGAGTPRDVQKSYFWVLLASDQKDPNTVGLRAYLEDTLSIDQRAAVQTAVRNWVPKNIVPPAHVTDTTKDIVSPKEAVSAQSTPGNTSLDTKLLASCAAETSTIKRLTCFDEVAKASGLAPKNKDASTTSSGKWQISSQSDPLTDKVKYFSRLKADEEINGSGDLYSLEVRCVNSHTELLLISNNFLDANDMRVTSRIDKNVAMTEDWNISTDRKALFMPQPVTTLKKFVDASRFLVNFTPYGKNPITAVFDISGSLDALTALRRDCKW